MKRSLSACAIALVVLGAPSHARAEEAKPAGGAASAATAETQEEQVKREAARRFEQAIQLYEEADYVLALAEFERVYELAPDYRVLYNIGQVSIQLSRYARAYRTLKEYLKQGGAELSSERVASVEADLELLSRRTASVLVTVDQPGAEISIDGIVIGSSPLTDPLIVDVGERRIQVKLRGFRPQSRTVSLAGGDRRDTDFKLEKDTTSDLPKAVAPPPGSLKPKDEGSRPGLWVGWISTGTLAAGAAVTGILGLSAADELKELRDTKGAERSELDGKQARAETMLLAADLLGAAAIVTGVVTLYVHLSGSPSSEPAGKRPKPSLAVALTGSQLNLTYRH